MDAIAVLRISRAVDSGTNKRVGELDPPADLDQARVNRGWQRVPVDPEQRGASVKQDWIAERFGRREKEEEPGLSGELLEALCVSSLDRAGHSMVVRHAEPARKSSHAPGTAQLEEGERIPVTLGDNPLANLSIK